MKRLKSILQKDGGLIRHDLQDLLGDLPDWLVPIVKDLLACAGPSPEDDLTFKSSPSP
ncbi:hypothetical protein ACE103_10215 [Bradyrhizobium sp. ma5]|uniref:hypothetical protein n=1 Tax=Bradyrhizobium sp. ma5 TaxID=3344828 RepID=UPI0035D503A6